MALPLFRGSLEKLHRMKRYFLALPLLLYLVHSYWFLNYVVDDAAITFSYARNIAQYGSFSLSPNGEWVEGFSHPLWLFLLLPFAQLKIDLVIAAKLLGYVTAMAALFLFARLPSIADEREPHWFDLLAPSLLAMNTGFVMWSMSGLENGLTTFLLLALLFQLIKDDWLGAAVISFLLAFTRPEGALLAFVLLLYLRRKAIPPICFLLVASLVALFIRFRIFSQWLPNTFWAKKGFGLAGLFSPFSPGWTYIFHNLSEAGLYLLLLLVPLGLYFSAKSLKWTFGPLLFVSMIFPLWAGGDWMPCGRFLTPFLLSLFLLAQEGIRGIHTHLQQKQLVWLLVLAALFFPLYETIHLTALNSKEPTVHMNSRVSRGKWFASLAEKLTENDASILEPDVGGVAYGAPSLRVMDLSGLCDLAIARHRFRPRFFIPYVLDERKPTFVHLHGAWSALCGLATNERFRAEYLPISGDTKTIGDGSNWIRRSLFEVEAQKQIEPLHTWSCGIELMSVQRVTPQSLTLLFRQTRLNGQALTLLVGNGANTWWDENSLLFQCLPPQQWATNRWYKSVHKLPSAPGNTLLLQLNGEGGGKKGLPLPSCSFDDLRQLASNGITGDAKQVINLSWQLAKSSDEETRKNFVKALGRLANSNPRPPSLWWDTVLCALPPSFLRQQELEKLINDSRNRLASQAFKLMSAQKSEEDWQAFLLLSKATRLSPQNSYLTRIREELRSRRLARATKELTAPFLETIKKDPASAASWKNLGDLYLNEHLWLEAIRAFEESLAWAKREDLGNIYVRLAACKYKMADLWGARRACEQALECGARVPPSLQKVLGVNSKG